MLSQDTLITTVQQSFIDEVSALKPGNVNSHSGGHGMQLEHFLRSAKMVSPILCEPTLDVGNRLLHAVRATMQHVGCNTNLGMLLLYAPIIEAARRIVFDKHFPVTPQRLQDEVSQVLTALNTPPATASIYEAIRLANPGGLGKVDCYDVHDPSPSHLLSAMKNASHYDQIAQQYVNNFSCLFTDALVIFQSWIARHKKKEWAIIACYLYFLSRFHDSHVKRKWGAKAAIWLQQQGEYLWDTYCNANQPESMKSILLSADQRFKIRKINPGTSADLTSAVILIYNLAVLEKD